VYRSPGGSFSGGGFRSGVSPGGGVYRTGPRSPSPGVTRPPGTTTPGGGAYAPGRAGSFFGGLAAGALLGHLFNPFAGFGWGWGSGYGYGAYGFGWSIVSLLIWAALLYAAYRIIRRLFGGGRGRGPGGGWQR
jgi:predicted lipid-binding transport protein (Tim44 family)